MVHFCSTYTMFRYYSSISNIMHMEDSSLEMPPAARSGGRRRPTFLTPCVSKTNLLLGDNANLATLPLRLL